MAFNLQSLTIGNLYSRIELAEIWGYKSFHAFSRGVFTPAKTGYIVLFVTREKQSSAIQYNDFINLDRLYWEGEEKHSTDHRIAEAHQRGEDIHLFYRDIHHTPFRYYGSIRIHKFVEETSKPSKFVFELLHDLGPGDDINQAQLELSKLVETERQAVVKARLGQGQFREDLLKYWKACAVTGIAKPELLRASHIKPWRRSENIERLNPFNGILLMPQYDHLFDRGYITFDDTGLLEPSPAIQNIPQEKLGIDFNVRLRKLQRDHLPFLKYHREKMFLRRVKA